MAAKDAFDAAVCAAVWAVLFDSVDHVLRAGGLIATVAAHDGGECVAIDHDEEDEETREEVV
ncbi:hypothetical protein KS4_26620 [Poriferisphaera corsica]|uniref:Uncharacterized protein n=1 Tax=Poriferisphaera corsica TaxID=2528020 RepID=A0A517YWI7_9BACT|nr:hypothetical protein KS4_26620 [Poriferisphaera corsica]